MPSKAMCPQCGQKSRGPSHICDPAKVQRENRRQDVLHRTAQASKK